MKQTEKNHLDFTLIPLFPVEQASNCFGKLIFQFAMTFSKTENPGCQYNVILGSFRIIVVLTLTTKLLWCWCIIIVIFSSKHLFNIVKFFKELWSSHFLASHFTVMLSLTLELDAFATGCAMSVMPSPPTPQPVM